MAQKLPKKTRETIFSLVYEEADLVQYLAQDRVLNGQFMDRLANDSRIGGVLKQHMPPGAVRTYIKDSILNRYAKDRNREALQRVTSESLLRQAAGEICEQGTRGGVSLFSSVAQPSQYYVISEGTCQKWETALRKALEYVATLPEETQSKGPEIGLKCTSPRGSLTESDKKQIRDALAEVSVTFYCIEY